MTITSHAGAAPGATGSGAPAIRIKGVSKTFGRGSEFTVALKEVDLDVAEREFLCIVGASGCGKSTLLNLIAELDEPSTGTIETGGRKVAFMFQEATLFPWLTAGQNVDLALKLRGMPKSERKDRVEELLALVHLGGRQHKRPHELSGGMRQRTQLARVLAQEAEIVLMDEPFAALDAMTRDSMHDEIERIKDELGLTIVFVTHNVREAVRLGDRTVLFFSSPGRVKTEYPIDFERPRRFDMPGLAELSGQALGNEAKPKSSSKSLALKAWTFTWPKLLAIAIVIGIWQFAYAVEWKPSFVLPSPFTVLQNLWDQLFTGRLWEQISLTMRRGVLGFCLALAIGTTIGIAVVQWRTLRLAIGSMIAGLQTMPSIVWFPLAILFFGLTETAIMFVVVLGAAPSIASGVITGIDEVPPPLLRAGKMIGATGINKYRYITLPAAMPSYLAGLKQGWAFSWRSLLAGELLVTIQGSGSLGSALNFARTTGNAVNLYTFMIVIFVIGVLVDAFFGFITKRIREKRGLTGHI